MHRCVMTALSALLALASASGASLAHPDAATPKEILKQREELARRMDALAATLPDTPHRSALGRLTQWYNWGNWPNGWSNWRNW